MADIKPYVCTFEMCEMKLFPDRHTWFAHVLQNHLLTWRCCFCRANQGTLEGFQRHLRKNHSEKATDSELHSLAKGCQERLDKIPPSACTLCDTWEAKLRELNKHISADENLVVTPLQYRHHVGSHMEQLALFAIPRGFEEDGGGSLGTAAPRRGSGASSDRSSVYPDYDEQDNPRLHIAAFEGRKDEIEELIAESDGRVLLESGTTWGNGMRSVSKFTN
jgi:hypothetical protein